MAGTQTLGPVEHLSMLLPSRLSWLHGRSMPGGSPACVLPPAWAYLPGVWLPCISLKLSGGADRDLALSASSDRLFSESPSQPNGA